jgi:hypothetical protein
MRKCSLTLLVILLVLALGLGAVACGSGSTGGKTPQQLLTASIEAGKSATSQSGTYQIDINLAAGSTDTTAGAAGLGQNFKVTGMFATQATPARADLSADLDLMGMTVSAGLRAIDTKSWINVLGQWYEIPADQAQQSGTSGSADVAKAVQEAIDEQAIDFNTWFKDLKAVGNETLAGTEVTHLSGTPDVPKIATDVVALMQNPKVAALLADAGSTAGAETGVTVPDATQIAQLQTTLEQMIQNATVDLWVAKSDSSMRKIVLTAKVVVPAEMGMSTVSGADLVFTINLDAPGKAIEVQAPASAKPIADLQTDLQSNPLFSGFLGGFLGTDAAGSTDTTVQ